MKKIAMTHITNAKVINTVIVCVFIRKIQKGETFFYNHTRNASLKEKEKGINANILSNLLLLWLLLLQSFLNFLYH